MEFDRAKARGIFDKRHPRFSLKNEGFNKEFLSGPTKGKPRNKFRRTPENSFERWALKNPEKVKAHKAVFHAVRNGTLLPEPCFCGVKAHAHHEDYSKPLDVAWLCPFHHKQRHKELSTDKDG